MTERTDPTKEPWQEGMICPHTNSGICAAHVPAACMCFKEIAARLPPFESIRLSDGVSEDK